MLGAFRDGPVHQSRVVVAAGHIQIEMGSAEDYVAWFQWRSEGAWVDLLSGSELAAARALGAVIMDDAANSVAVLYPLHFEFVAIVVPGTAVPGTAALEVPASQQVHSGHHLAHWRSRAEEEQHCHVVWWVDQQMHFGCSAEVEPGTVIL